MLFNSLEYLIYFPIVVGLYFWLPERWRWLHLLIASYAFYMAWEPAYALLILGSTAIDYFCALGMPAATPARRKALLGVSLVMNLGLLFSFKYYNLINGSFTWLLAQGGVAWPLPESNLLLPVGISFYTFQTLSYTVDVYRGNLAPERHFGIFALYVSYFPQLVAGPIERAGALLPQLRAAHALDVARVVSGLRLMLWGLFKKAVVADRLGEIVDAVFAAPEQAGGFAVTLVSFCIGYQVYCDFSGYSDMAVGAARVMGVDLMRNFDQPHLARSVNEFWSRWHISLISWFRDYVYIPLGGSRRGKLIQYRNIAVIFLLSGLWHGAAWTFAIWGSVNAVYIITGAITAPARERFAQWSGFARWVKVRIAWQWASTLAIVCAGHIWFRAPDVHTALLLYSRAGSGWAELDAARFEAILARFGMDPTLFVFTLLLIPATELIEYRFRHLEAWRAPMLLTWLGDWTLLGATLLLGRYTREAFVYFQF